MRIITVKMDEELVQLIDLYAVNKRMSRSEVIREAVIEYLVIRGVKIDG